MPNNPDGNGFVPHPQADKLRQAVLHLHRAASALQLCAAGDGEYLDRLGDCDTEADHAAAIVEEVFGARL